VILAVDEELGVAVLSAVILLSMTAISVQAGSLAQIPTVFNPTVTGTPPGAVAIVTMEQDQINVRGGPSTDYPIVGVLIAGQEVPALGRSVGGDWVEIAYPGYRVVSPGCMRLLSICREVYR